jgi:hypothetical protein
MRKMVVTTLTFLTDLSIPCFYTFSRIIQNPPKVGQIQMIGIIGVLEQIIIFFIFLEINKSPNFLRIKDNAIV